MSMETTCKEFVAYKMSLSKGELELLETALRDSICTSTERLAAGAYGNTADFILNKVKNELLGMAQLLMRVNCAVERAYAAEEENEKKED